MRIRLPFMIQDQYTAAATGLERSIQAFDWDDERYEPEVFLDGPVSSRVAVLDFDEQTGMLLEPVLLDRAGRRAEYLVELLPDDRRFQAVSTFATVLKTLALYESPDVLGRRIEWAFDGPQLLIVPRAGTWQNAYYERESRSLQFFSFPGSGGIPVVHTSLSHDIVAHEAGHAILDAIAPHLYDCVNPQSLALHEAIGDLTALFSTLGIGSLREQLLRQTNGDIRGLNAYSQVAEEFGFFTTQTGALRTLWNDATLATAADPADFHDLSQILTGAVYRLFVGGYERRWDRLSDGTRNVSHSGRALWEATQAIERFALRGLDYLPPGEISMADYGRAVIAADAVSNPDESRLRDAFAELLTSRVGVAAQELQPTAFDAAALDPVALDPLIQSDWHAYQLVDANRDVLNVPSDIPFRVEPRLRVTKTAYRGSGTVSYEEVILKISWELQQDSGTRKFWLRYGTTAVFDEAGRVAALITTRPESAAPIANAEEAGRNALLDRLVALDLASFDPGVGQAALMVQDGAIRIKATGRSLHLGADVGAPVSIAGVAQ